MLHYLDDFITVGPLDSPLCAQYLQTAFNVCEQLGLPLHPATCAWFSPVLTILGTELDYLVQVARLPVDKFVALKSLVPSWSSRRWCTRRELESLIGRLRHAVKVVWPGRTFLCRMIDLLLP